MKKHIIFAGTPDFCVPSLKMFLEDERFAVDLIVTQPDRPVGRRKIVTAPPAKVVALEHGVPVFQPESLNEEWKDYQEKNAIAQPDFLVVIAYGQIFSADILTLPRIAAVNLHASLLPRWRGASPIQHTILAGDTEGGVTVQRMVKGLDAGPVLSQRAVSIDAGDTSATLFRKLSVNGAELLIDTLTRELYETPQDDAKATFCRKLSRADGVADPKTMTAEEIDRRVRALTPWPGVTIGTTKIIATSLVPAPSAISIPCAGNSTLYVTSLQSSGGKPVSGAEWKRGHAETELV